MSPPPRSAHRRPRSRTGVGCTTSSCGTPSSSPRFHERLEALFDALVEHLSARPDVTGEQARVVLTAAAAVFQLSVEDALDRPALGGFDDRLQTNLALLRQAAGAPRT